MRRSLALLGAAAATAAGHLALAPTSAQAAAPPAALTKIVCHSTLDPAKRSVSVISIMRHRPATQSLAVRFTLLEKVSGAAATPVRDGDLGHWTTPTDAALGQLPADVWKLRKAVYNVDAPAVYRFRVTFRWTGRGGKVISRQTLHTGSCPIRELRPDVLVRSVAVHANGLAPGNNRYVAVIANRGRTPSGPFEVEFAPGAAGGSAQTARVPSLGPRAHTRVRFLGRACNPAGPPTVIADPAHVVDDFDLSNNTFTVVCPSAATAALTVPEW
jgi:CARDB